MKCKKEAHKLYYIESYPSMTGERIELYTWEDAREVVDYSLLLHPEKELLIREFEF